MMSARWIMVASALACGSSPALAQPSTTERVLRSFTDCRSITAADARLACFDKAAGALENAVKAKDVTIVDRQDMRQARRSLFGFPVPHLPQFGVGDGKDEPAFTELNTTVKTARALGNGRVEMTLAETDLGVWQTTDPVNFPPHPGAKIRVRQGLMSNYFLNFEGRTYRGTRLR